MRFWIAGFTALTLTACQSGQMTHTVLLDVTKVTLPASIGASADLPLTVTVTIGGCTTFKSLDVQQRTAGVLELLAQGTESTGKNVACPANIGYQDVAYTDPGTPARVSPFEVIVNGQSYGTVEIK